MAQRSHAVRLAVTAIGIALVAASCGGDNRPTPATPSAPTAPPVTPTATPTATPSPTAPAVIPSPAGATFYAVPDPLPLGDPGALVWAQRVAAPSGAIAWRVLYHSRSVQDA